MTSHHVRIIEEIERNGVLSQWQPDDEDWPIVLQLLEAEIILAERSGLMMHDQSWPDNLSSVRLSLDAHKKLAEWKESIWSKTWKGRIWTILKKFTLWIGVLIGVGLYKAIEIIVTRAMTPPPHP